MLSLWLLFYGENRHFIQLQNKGKQQQGNTENNLWNHTMLNLACAAVAAGEVSYKEGRIKRQGHDHVRKDESLWKTSSQQYLSLAFLVEKA